MNISQLHDRFKRKLDYFNHTELKNKFPAKMEIYVYKTYYPDLLELTENKNDLDIDKSSLN